MYNAIQDKSFRFAVRVVKLCKYLQNTQREYTLSRQLLKCGTSIGANVAESQQAQSRLDFVSKLKGTSKNSPLTIWPDLSLQQFLSESPQYTKYSGLSETFVEPKSLAQIIKKEFLEVA